MNIITSLAYSSMLSSCATPTEYSLSGQVTSGNKWAAVARMCDPPLPANCLYCYIEISEGTLDQR